MSPEPLCDHRWLRVAGRMPLIMCPACGRVRLAGRRTDPGLGTVHLRRLDGSAHLSSKIGGTGSEAIATPAFYEQHSSA